MGNFYVQNEVEMELETKHLFVPEIKWRRYFQFGAKKAKQECILKLHCLWPVEALCVILYRNAQ